MNEPNLSQRNEPKGDHADQPCEHEPSTPEIHASEQMNPYVIDLEACTPVSQLPDDLMQAIPRALVRAARRAREIAAQTGTPLIVSRGGQVVEYSVTDRDLESRPTPTGYAEMPNGPRIAR